jgi:aminoglycoside phosphotransferase (APT) family kinase protein
LDTREGELAACAAVTLDRVHATRRDSALPIDAASRRAVRRVVGSLGAMRRELFSAAPFAPTFIHGDLHPGNVVLAARGAGPTPVLLDWGRARVGSPLEDVASWLQTLACWEPAARARHDTLLAAYVRARGGGAVLGAPLRRAVWLAGASNALAGALLHQLDVATRPETPRAARAPARRAT